jgi:hypothetical protein
MSIACGYFVQPNSACKVDFCAAGSLKLIILLLYIQKWAVSFSECKPNPESERFPVIFPVLRENVHKIGSAAAKLTACARAACLFKRREFQRTIQYGWKQLQ